MIKALVLATALFSMNAFASSVNIYSGQTFVGQEQVDFKPTGKTCVVTVQNLFDYSIKGNTCKQVKVSYHFHNEELSREQQTGKMQTRVTNYHTKEYPQKRSCAEPMYLENGVKAKADIYGEDTTYLYNPMFNGEADVDGTEFHYFLSISGYTKTPTRAAINVVGWFSETLWECVNLQDATPSL